VGKHADRKSDHVFSRLFSCLFFIQPDDLTLRRVRDDVQQAVGALLV
jgi:hypothetical protein